MYSYIVFPDDGDSASRLCFPGIVRRTGLPLALQPASSCLGRSATRLVTVAFPQSRLGPLSANEDRRMTEP